MATGFKGGEGSVWSREGFLLFSDYSQDRIYKYIPGKAPEVYREGSNGANGNTMDRQGRLYLCEDKARRVTRTDRKGRIEVLVDRFEGKRFNAPNDIVVRRDGHVYFTDPLDTPLDVRDLDFYGIYHVTPKGRIEAIARMQTRPNGVTLSPDGKILYVGNERTILAYDLNRNGQASNERVSSPTSRADRMASAPMPRATSISRRVASPFTRWQASCWAGSRCQAGPATWRLATRTCGRST